MNRPAKESSQPSDVYSSTLKKGSIVDWNNNYGSFSGKIKTIIPNANGEKIVIVLIGYRQTVSIPISKLSLRV